jgi:Putative sensor
MTTTPLGPTLADGGSDGFGRLRERRPFLRTLFGDTGYVLLGFPLALVAFCLLLTGVLAGVGLIVVWIGLPILAVSLAAARGLAELQRRLLPAVLHERVRQPAYRTPRRSLAGVIDVVADVRRWLDAVHGIVAMPVATVTWSLVVTWWAAALGGVTYGLWEWSLPDGPDNTRLAELLGWDGRGADILLHAAIGLFALVTLPLVVRGCALLQAKIARALLTAGR